MRDTQTTTATITLYVSLITKSTGAKNKSTENNEIYFMLCSRTRTHRHTSLIAMISYDDDDADDDACAEAKQKTEKKKKKNVYLIAIDR